MLDSSPGLRRGLRVVALLAQQQPQGFSALRRQLDNVAAPTLSRLLTVLQEEGWVQAVAGGYACGPTCEAAARKLLSDPDPTALCCAAVDELARSSGESAAWLDWDGEAIRFRYHQLMGDSYHYLPIGSSNGDGHNGFVVLGRHLDGGGPPPNVAMAEDGLGEHRDRGFRVAMPLRHGCQLCGLVGVSSLDMKPSASRRRTLAALVRAAALRMQEALNLERP